MKQCDLIHYFPSCVVNQPHIILTTSSVDVIRHAKYLGVINTIFKRDWQP